MLLKIRMDSSFYSEACQLTFGQKHSQCSGLNANYLSAQNTHGCSGLNLNN